MIKIGLTGGIGSGKSTVSELIKSKGIPVIDADAISRKVIDKYPVILENIIKAFGSDFVDDEGKLKRRELGSFIFKSKERKDKLEYIIYPYIKTEIFEEFDKYNKEGVNVCVLDAPTLIEKGLHEVMDVNILVWVDKNAQLERVSKRDGLSVEEITDRINSQISLDIKAGMVDYVIDNSKSLDCTKEQLSNILEKLI